MAAPARDSLPLGDDILAEILIRLPTLADVGRACAACVAFRRVITRPSFLRRLHALHPRSLLGFHTLSAGFLPVEPPYPSAPAARAVDAAADFSFSFLPSLGYRWMVRDARDGRFLLDCVEGMDCAFTTVAVCDPLFRRYVLLPPIPQHLAAAVEQPRLVNAERRCEVFLAPCGEEDDDLAADVAEKSFRVIWMAQCPTKLVVLVFTSASGQWQATASSSWRDLNPSMPSATQRCYLHLRHYAYRCFYWLLWSFNAHQEQQMLVVLDVDRMEFSPLNPPSSYRLKEFAIVELGENRLGMFASKRMQGSVLQLFRANKQNHGEGAIVWELQNQVSLIPSYSYHKLGVVDGQLLIQGAPHVSYVSDFGCMLLDFRTSQLQKIRGILQSGSRPQSVLYTGYPPSLSLPII
ncbi:hypothetical protein ACP70R_005606 [Stipagrostis hirtigluma subsp. patula]